MLGEDPLSMNLKQAEHPKVVSIKTKISRSVHEEGDSQLCAVYTENNPFSKCVINELREIFLKELGCVPPLLEKGIKKMCNKVFNFSDAKATYVNTLSMSTYFHNKVFSCKTPCTKNVFSSKFLHTSPDPNMMLIIVFDKTVEVAHSDFSIDEQTLLTRLGGSVSSGRTLLWIFLTILAASQVLQGINRYRPEITWKSENKSDC